MGTTTDFFWTQQVSSLLSMSVESLVKCSPRYIDDISILPSTLKDQIIKLMAKRGFITDNNLHKVISNSLKVLDLSECEVTDTGLLKLSKCQNIRKIDLNSAKSSRDDVTSAGVIHVAHCCPLLEVVYLRRCTSLTDEGVEVLAANCPRLRELNIGGVCLLTDRSLDALGQHCRHLSSLNISKANVCARTEDSDQFCPIQFFSELVKVCYSMIYFSN
ncbi:protein AMN1 homolog isoform X2 [Tubulanus polymorphus]|uniref:protein AMN1 homolog isoform X2 n=1 Tax=Tubulanus polymorphus TaxID=672921 RepID=UPI003DA58A53